MMAAFKTWARRILNAGFLCVGLFCWSSALQAASGNYMVLGVIASNHEHAGVALIKDLSRGRTFAAREGMIFDRSVTVVAVRSNSVELKINTDYYVLRVGDDLAAARQQGLVNSQPASTIPTAGDVERDGDTVRLSGEYRDHLVGSELQKVLMQAAAVPYYDGGHLAGFRLMEIDAGSIYSRAGLQDGDVITDINGRQLNDVSSTVKMLMGLKNDNAASLTYMRDGQKHTLNIAIQ